jgi:hypothetical protein
MKKLLKNATLVGKVTSDEKGRLDFYITSPKGPIIYLFVLRDVVLKVGLTVNFKKRISAYRKPTHETTQLIVNAMKKYSIDSFDMYIIPADLHDVTWKDHLTGKYIPSSDALLRVKEIYYTDLFAANTPSAFLNNGKLLFQGQK